MECCFCKEHSTTPTTRVCMQKVALSPSQITDKTEYIHQKGQLVRLTVYEKALAKAKAKEKYKREVRRRKAQKRAARRDEEKAAAFARALSDNYSPPSSQHSSLSYTSE